MAKSAADVDEDWTIRTQIRGLFLDRIHREPGRHSFALLHHVLLKVLKSLRILLKPNEGRYVYVPGRLKDTLCTVGDRLIFGLYKKFW